MPRVRCPSCERLLNVADDLVGRDAKCPLCGTVFPAEPEGGRPMAYQPMPDVPDPLQPWRPTGTPRREPEAETPARVPPFTRVRRDEHERPADPIRRAGNWLFGLSLAGIVWNLTCGCAGLAVFARRAMPAEAAFGVASAFLIQLIGLTIVLVASQSLRVGGRNRALCWTGIVLAHAEALFAAGRLLLVVAAVDGPRPAEAGGALNGASALLSIGLVIAGAYAASVLRATPRQEPED